MDDELETRRTPVHHHHFSEHRSGAMLVALLLLAAIWFAVGVRLDNGCASGLCDARLPDSTTYTLYPAQIHAVAERRIIEGVMADFLDTDRFHAVPRALHDSVWEEHNELLPTDQLAALQSAIPFWRRAAHEHGHAARAKREIEAAEAPSIVSRVVLSSRPNGFIRWLRTHAESQAAIETQRYSAVHQEQRAAARSILSPSPSQQVLQMGALTTAAALFLLLLYVLRCTWRSRPREVVLTRHTLGIGRRTWLVEDGSALAALGELSGLGYDVEQLRTLNRMLAARSKARDGQANPRALRAISARLDAARKT